MRRDERIAELLAEARARGLQYAINDVASWTAHARDNLGDEEGRGLSVLQSWTSMEILIEHAEKSLATPGIPGDPRESIARLEAYVHEQRPSLIRHDIGVLLDVAAAATVEQIRALLPKLDGLDVTLRREFEAALENSAGVTDAGPAPRPSPVHPYGLDCSEKCRRDAGIEP